MLIRQILLRPSLLLIVSSFFFHNDYIVKAIESNQHGRNNMLQEEVKNSGEDSDSCFAESHIVSEKDKGTILKLFSDSLDKNEYHPSLSNILTPNTAKHLITKENLISKLQDTLQENTQFIIEDHGVCNNYNLQKISTFLREETGWGLFYFDFFKNKYSMQNMWNINMDQLMVLLQTDNKKLNDLSRLQNRRDSHATVKLHVNTVRQWKIKLFFDEEQTKNGTTLNVEIDVAPQDNIIRKLGRIIRGNRCDILEPREDFHSRLIISQYNRKHKDSFKKIIAEFTKKGSNNNNNHQYLEIIKEIRSLYEDMRLKIQCDLLSYDEESLLILSKKPDHKKKLIVKEFFIDMEEENYVELLSGNDINVNINSLFKYLESKRLLSEEHIKKREALQSTMKNIIIQYKENQYIIKLSLYFSEPVYYNKEKFNIYIPCANLLEMEGTLENVLRLGTYHKYLSLSSYLKEIDEQWKIEELEEIQEIQKKREKKLCNKEEIKEKTRN